MNPIVMILETPSFTSTSFYMYNKCNLKRRKESSVGIYQSIFVF